MDKNPIPTLSEFFNFNTSNIEIRNELINYVDSYTYFQYKNYPSQNKDSWKSFYKYYLDQLFNNDEWKFHFEKIENIPFLLGCRFSKWDSDHFGYKVAFINILLGGTIENKALLDNIIKI